MISGATSCNYPNVSQGLQINMYNPHQEVIPSSINQSSNCNHSNSLLYSLSLLKDKVHQVQTLVNILVSQHGHQSQSPESTSMALASMGTMIQEIIVTASSMVFTCQQIGMDGGTNNLAHNNSNSVHVLHSLNRGKAQEPILGGQERGQSFFSSETFDWYGDSYNNNNTSSCNTMHGTDNNNSSNDNHTSNNRIELSQGGEARTKGLQANSSSSKNYDIIELDAADLLAKYTHFCHVCGKGFKRDANLRMHMRAHGDEYKTNAALSNPMKHVNINNANEVRVENSKDPLKLPRKYSCPHEGCRWNQKHAKFQPLKSMICVKNHYKRSHCPKMYVCKRCNRKQFSVLSDLRTHEKHCGDLKWQCSCGTTFSRKDKLMGHVALFVGHTPATPLPSSTKPAKVENQPIQMHLEYDRG